MKEKESNPENNNKKPKNETGKAGDSLWKHRGWKFIMKNNDQNSTVIYKLY